MGNATVFTVLTAGETAFAYDGFLYVVGGTYTSSNVHYDYSTVYYAPITAAGGLGNWSYSNKLSGLPSGGVYYAAGVGYDGYFYMMGGINGTTNMTPAPSFYTSTNPIPKVGDYSTIYNIGQGVNVTPRDILVNGTNTANYGSGQVSGIGGIIVNNRNGSTNCSALGSVSSLPTGSTAGNYSIFGLGVPNLFTFSSDGCTSPTLVGVGEYAWIQYILDDTQTAIFPDVASSHTNVTSYQIFYYPSVGTRLRGGATFTGQSLQSLDAPPY